MKTKTVEDNGFDVPDEDSRRHARRRERLFAVLRIAVLVVLAAPVVVFVLYRERDLMRGGRSYTCQAVGSKRPQTVKKKASDPAVDCRGEAPQIVNVVRQVTNVIEKCVDVMVERKMTNYIDKVVNVTNYVDKVVDVTNYVDKVVDVVILRTNKIERQVSLPTFPETSDDQVRERNEPIRQIERTLAELAEEMNVGLDEPNVSVTNVVERKVDVEVIRMVTNYVDRPVEVVVDRPVTNIVERTVEVAVDRFVTNWVDRPVTVNVDRVFTNVVEHPVEITIKRPVTNVVERKVDFVVERPVTNFIDRIVDVPVDRVVTNLVQRPVDVYIDVPVTNIVERTVEVTVDRFVTNWVDRPVTNYVERKIRVQVDRPRQTAVQMPQVRRPARLTTPYRVKPGDTVGGLAKRYGFRIPDFRVYNPQVNINRISIGQILYLPGDLDADSTMTAR